jgi:hypothetical protein
LLRKNLCWRVIAQLHYLGILTDFSAFFRFILSAPACSGAFLLSAMTLLFQLLCTGFFAILMWTLYSVLSTPSPTKRALFLWLAGISALVAGLHILLGAPLGTTTGPKPMDKLFFLLTFDGMLVILRVVNPWLRQLFARHAQQQPLPIRMSENLLAVNDFLANKALYVMLYLYQLLAIWLPKVA